MTYIDLPRALEDYFAFAEIDSTRHGRRFTITLPYFEGQRLDRLQWWYHLSREQEARLGEASLGTLRAQAIERFRKHIGRWLQNTGQRLHAHRGDPIPRILSLTAAEPVASAAPPPSAAVPTRAEEPTAAGEPAGNVLPWPAERVANG